jgi:hypothetical protein
MVPRWSFGGEKEKKRNERDIEHALGSSQQRHLPVKSRGYIMFGLLLSLSLCCLPLSLI